MRSIALAAAFLATITTAHAACEIKDARVEEAIATKKALRSAENEQLVRDLRTLRDAAIVLDTYQHPVECEALIAIVRTLAAHPKTAVERGGDTDEDKAEEVAQARKPKPPVGEVSPKAK